MPVDLDRRVERDAFLGRAGIGEAGDQLGIVARQERAGIEHRDRAPSRRWACANSIPIGPPPITIRCSGRSRLAKIVSLVR